MKKFFMGLIVLVGLSVNAQEKLNGQCVIERQLASHQGCCSHHGGICGCGGYRLLCCDGTLSPSCECLQDDVQLEESEIRLQSLEAEIQEG